MPCLFINCHACRKYLSCVGAADGEIQSQGTTAGNGVTMTGNGATMTGNGVTTATRHVRRYNGRFYELVQYVD